MAIIPADEKVFMVDKRTNTTYGGSQALQDMQQWYTMQDVADSVQPYKVFTALLTQSGEDSPQSIGSGAVTKGVTYRIESNDGDYSNVGAPNNNEYTEFVATIDAEPTTWGSIGLSYNAGAPVATVLENTIGNVWFTYDTVGQYNINSDVLFIDNKTAIFNKALYSWRRGIIIDVLNSSEISIKTIALDGGNGENGLLSNTPIEIRVYN
jgi:hypothetical protein